MDTLTPAAPWVALLLAVVALLWCRALRQDVRALRITTDSLRRRDTGLELVLSQKADKRPARKPTPLADSERLLAGAARSTVEASK